jgi:diacylglycerol kinase
VRDALDMASAAVLMAAIGSAMIGALVFVYRLGLMTGWWTG